MRTFKSAQKSAKKSAFTNKSAQKSTLKSTFGSSEPIWTWTQACVFKTQWKSINIPKNSAPKDSCVLKHDQNALF